VSDQLRIVPRETEEIRRHPWAFWRSTLELLDHLEAQEEARTAAANSDPGATPAKGRPESAES